MGYRSDVAALMYSKGGTPEEVAIIREFIRQRVTPELMKYFDFDGWGAVFEVEQWKWYESYADIQMLEKLFDEYQEAFCGGHGVDYDCKYAYEFIRVGESYDDIETHEAGAEQGRLSVDRFIRIE